MPKDMRTLFIGHEASLTGAPKLLLGWLEWLRDSGKLDGELWLNRGGPLIDEYRAILPVTVLDNESQRLVRRILRKVAGLSWERRMEGIRLRSRLRKSRPNKIWSNTGANGYCVDCLSNQGIPIVCNLHELPNTIHQFIGGEAFRRNHRNVSRWVACSKEVSTGLIENFGVGPNCVTVVPEFHTITKAEAAAAHCQRDQIRSQLNLGPSDFLVGMVGTMDPRKGTDVFIRLARNAAREERFSALRFVWIGGGDLLVPHSYALHDIRQLKLGDRLRLVPPTVDVKPYLAAMDAFCLTSKVDPYPVAMLEAAAMQLPILGFSGTGGVSDFVSHGTGLIAPYLDESKMLSHILYLSQNRAVRDALGKRASEVSCNEYTIDSIGPKLLGELSRTV